MMNDKTPRLAAKDAGEEERRQAAALMGSAKTERKRVAVLNNLAQRTADQMGGKPPKLLTETLCRCGATDLIKGHHWTCPRAVLIKRRQRQGLDIMTGRPLDGAS